jgi:hypothetical protein
VACDYDAALWYVPLLYLKKDILSMTGRIQHSGLGVKSFLRLEAPSLTSCLISTTAWTYLKSTTAYFQKSLGGTCSSQVHMSHCNLTPGILSHLDHGVGCLECYQIILHGRESHVSFHPVCRMTIVVTIDEGAFLEVEMGSTSGQVPGNGLADHFLELLMRVVWVFVRASAGSVELWMLGKREVICMADH